MVKTAKPVEKAKVEISTNEKQEQGLIILPKQERQVTASERIDKLTAMQTVASRYEHLTTKKEELDRILNSDNGLNGCKIIIESDRDDIEIKNTTVVGELLDFARATLTKLISKEEKLLLSMEV